MERIDQIIQGCKKQNQVSQELLYREFYPALYTLCKTFFSDPDDIITSLNNGMIRVFKNIDLFDPSKGSIFNWIYTAVRFAALTHLKNKKKDHRLVFQETIPDQSVQNPFQDQDWNHIFSLLEKLPPTTRAICSLFYIEGFSIKEITHSLGSKEGTVKWHLNESRNRLKELVNLNPTEIGR